MTWQRVLLSEFEQDPDLCIEILVLRKNISRSFTFARNGVRFHVLKCFGGLRTSTFFWLDTFLLRRSLRQIRPDLIHVWGTERGAGLVGSRLGYPYLVTIQGLLTWYRQIVPLHGYWRVAAALEQISLPRAPLITTESTFAVKFLQQRFPGVPVRQVEHAPDWLFHRVKRQPDKKTRRFICIGTAGYRKGTDVLLRALNALTSELDFELTLVGTPEVGFWEDFKTQLSPECLRRVLLKPNLTPHEVADELARTTLLIFPTRADTSPNAVKEAVVAGVPVVATEVGGITDYVFPGKNGILFPPGDVAACTDAIRAAMAHSLFSQGMVETETLEWTRAYLSPSRMYHGFRSAYHVLGPRGEQKRAESLLA